MRRLVFCLATVLVCAAAAAEPGWYLVRKGDTLGAIASRFGCTVAELKRDNGLTSDIIEIDQRLDVKQPFHRKRAADIRFQAPYARKGRVLEPFGPHREGRVVVPRSGLRMEYPLGGEVLCPAHGIVRHVGAMEEYGTLVIIEHGGGYHTVLAPLDEASVHCRPGQALLAGQPIGVTAAAPQASGPPFLHIELRKDEKAIDPARLVR